MLHVNSASENGIMHLVLGRINNMSNFLTFEDVLESVSTSIQKHVNLIVMAIDDDEALQFNNIIINNSDFQY